MMAAVSVNAAVINPTTAAQKLYSAVSISPVPMPIGR